MHDELAPHHLQVGILFVAMCDVTVRAVRRVRQRVKRVACCVHAHKSHSVVYRVQKLLLSIRRNGWRSIRSQCCQISGCKKYHGSVGVKFIAIEDPPVLGCAHLKSILTAQSRHCIVDDAGFSVDPLDHVMLKPRRFREHQDGFFLCPKQAAGKRQSRSCQSRGPKKLSASGDGVHESPLNDAGSDARSQERSRRHSLLYSPAPSCLLQRSITILLLSSSYSCMDPAVHIATSSCISPNI